MGVSKVVVQGNVLIDITDSTVTDGDLRDGITAYNRAGDKIIGNLSSGITVTNFSGTATLISGDDYKLTIVS